MSSCWIRQRLHCHSKYVQCTYRGSYARNTGQAARMKSAKRAALVLSRYGGEGFLEIPTESQDLRRELKRYPPDTYVVFLGDVNVWMGHLSQVSENTQSILQRYIGQGPKQRSQRRYTSRPSQELILCHDVLYTPMVHPPL